MLIALLALLLTVWMTNLYNFMDGSDGLAGGMALFGFSMYGVAALDVTRRYASDDELHHRSGRTGFSLQQLPSGQSVHG